jgi:hypothetical protein
MARMILPLPKIFMHGELRIQLAHFPSDLLLEPFYMLMEGVL